LGSLVHHLLCGLEPESKARQIPPGEANCETPAPLEPGRGFGGDLQVRANPLGVPGPFRQTRR